MKCIVFASPFQWIMIFKIQKKILCISSKSVFEGNRKSKMKKSSLEKIGCLKQNKSMMEFMGPVKYYKNEKRFASIQKAFVKCVCQIRIFSYDNKALSETKKQCVC